MYKNSLTVLAIIIIFSLTACVTQKKCLRKFPITSDTVRTVIIKDSLVYRDTTIFVTLPEQVRIDSVVIPCPPPPPSYIPDTARAETDFAIAIAWWKHPFINLKLIQKKSILELRLDSAIKEKFYWRNEYEKINSVNTIKKIPTIYRIAFWAWIGIFLIIFLAFLWFLYQKVFPKILP